jgi:hypothetical protein
MEHNMSDFDSLDIRCLPTLKHFASKPEHFETLYQINSWNSNPLSHQKTNPFIDYLVREGLLTLNFINGAGRLALEHLEKRSNLLPSPSAAADDHSSTDKAEDPRAYVTLRQMAAMVNKSKRTLENRKKRKHNPLPDADVPGGGGEADEWLWDHIRPWLENEFRRLLPEKFNPQVFKLK